jgi:hypothetical protein
MGGMKTGKKSGGKMGATKSFKVSPFKSLKDEGFTHKVKNEKRDLKAAAKADDFYSYLQDLANDFTESGMTSTAKDLRTAALHIDRLLAQIAERDAVLCDLREGAVGLGDAINDALHGASKGGAK